MTYSRAISLTYSRGPSLITYSRGFSLIIYIRGLSLINYSVTP